MRDGISLHGREYFNDLQKFRDMALEESHWLGRRKQMGRFTFGIAHAHWEAESGGMANLVEQGIRSGRRCINIEYPTRLEIYDHEDEADGIVMTGFKIDDDIGLIKVTKALITRPTTWGMLRIDLASRIERRHGLDDPIDEDRVRLYEEMERGASGMYPYNGFGGRSM